MGATNFKNGATRAAIPKKVHEWASDEAVPVRGMTGVSVSGGKIVRRGGVCGGGLHRTYAGGHYHTTWKPFGYEALSVRC